MIETLSEGADWFAVGAILLLLGYLIKVRRWTFLIAGYDDSLELPERVAASIVGNFVLRVGIASACFGLVVATVDVSALGPIFGALVVLGLARVIYRLNTYESLGGVPQ